MDLLEQAKYRSKDLLDRGNGEHRLLFSADTVPLERTISVIPQDACLVEFYYHKNSLQVLGVDSNGPAFFKTIDTWVLNRAIKVTKRMLFEKKSIQGSYKPSIYKLGDERLVKKDLSDLYDLIIKPIEPYINDKKRIIIVPHGIFHYVPFSALYNSDNHRFLVQDYSISLLPSASVLEFCRQRNPMRKKTCLAILRPLTDSKVAPAFIENPVNFFEKGYRLEGKQATRENLLRYARSYDIIHLATHAIFNSINGLDSYVALTKEDRTDNLVDKFRVIDIINHLELNAYLVVLSACKTGLNQIAPGDELIGFSRALFYAGACSLVLTLWEVDHTATLNFMEDFYSELTGVTQTDKATALQKAQIRAAVEENLHPYYWAGFTLIGDWI